MAVVLTPAILGPRTAAEVALLDRPTLPPAELSTPPPLPTKKAQIGALLVRSSAQTPAQLQARSKLDAARGLEDIVVSCEDLLAELAKWPRDPRALLDHNLVPLNLSDADGTLWSTNLGGVIIKELGQRGRFRPEVRPFLDEALEIMGLEPTGADGPDRGVNQDMLRMLKAFKDWLKRDPVGDDARRCHQLGADMFSWIFAGHTEAEVLALSHEAIDAVGFTGKFFEGAREMIGALKEIGINTEVISAGFEPMIRAAAIRLGIEPEHVHGTRSKLDPEGRITGEPLRITTGPQKASLAREIVRQRALELGVSPARLDALRPLLAHGDSPSVNDRDLLDFAHTAVVVEPESKADVEIALQRLADGRSVFVLDYQTTVDGEAADRFAQ